MDLGIEGKWALVCAASKGLGRGCAQALAAEGVNVVITARGVEALEATAAQLRSAHPGVEVRTVAGDITTPEGRAAALAACPQGRKTQAGGIRGQRRAGRTIEVTSIDGSLSLSRSTLIQARIRRIYNVGVNSA